MSKSFFETKKWKQFMNMVYGIGAAVVIAGALFKIMHWKGADMMLVIGMGTECVIFIISAFEPVHMDPDWSLVYPELAGVESEGKKDKKAASNLTVSQQLDQMLEEAKVGPELIESLGNGLKSLSQNVNEMSNLSSASVATAEYVYQDYGRNQQQYQHGKRFAEFFLRRSEQCVEQLICIRRSLC